MCVEDLYVVAEGTCLAIDQLQVTLQLVEVGLANRTGVHVESVLALKPDERGLDIQIKREFPVVEHREEHRVVPTVAQAGQRAEGASGTSAPYASVTRMRILVSTPLESRTDSLSSVEKGR